MCQSISIKHLSKFHSFNSSYTVKGANVCAKIIGIALVKFTSLALCYILPTCRVNTIMFNPSYLKQFVFNSF